MAILLATLLVFVGLMLIFQLIYFEISRKRALRVNNLVWFEQFNRPFNYTGTASMVVLCIICFMIGGYLCGMRCYCGCCCTIYYYQVW